ncbi:MAG: hypothetical protein AAF828_04535 [Bacteroidota bacterium]
MFGVCGSGRADGLEHQKSAEQISAGNGTFYTVRAGDILHFYATFTDEAGNATNLSWTLEVVT